MASDTTKLVINGPHSYRTEPVSLQHCAYPTAEPLTFAHVLNLPEGEDLWPGDAAELFFPDYFAVRLVGDDEVYRRHGAVWEHMRNEILRQAGDPQCQTLESTWKSEFMIDCYKLNGSYGQELFGEPLAADPFADSYWFDDHGDGSDDNPEPDTLNSELLLTEEYIAPDSVSNQQPLTKLSPQRRVGTIQPIEQED